MASTCDSEESIATPPPDSDLDHDQIRALLASPLYFQERQANAERLQVYQSLRENLMSSSSQDPVSTERPGSLCKYSQLHMRYIQSPTHPSTHVKRDRTERKTSRLQAQHHPHQEGLVPCLRVILDSGAYRWIHRWVQAGHPRYTGASTEEGRGWPDVTSTKTTNDNRRQDTDKRQDKRACNDQVLRNVNSHTAELGFLHGSGAGSRNRRSTESCRNP